RLDVGGGEPILRGTIVTSEKGDNWVARQKAESWQRLTVTCSRMCAAACDSSAWRIFGLAWTIRGVRLRYSWMFERRMNFEPDTSQVRFTCRAAFWRCRPKANCPTGKLRSSSTALAVPGVPLPPRA